LFVFFKSGQHDLTFRVFNSQVINLTICSKVLQKRASSRYLSQTNFTA